MFWLGMGAGAVIGVVVGFFIAALFIVGKRGDTNAR